MRSARYTPLQIKTRKRTRKSIADNYELCVANAKTQIIKHGTKRFAVEEKASTYQFYAIAKNEGAVHFYDVIKIHIQHRDQAIIGSVISLMIFDGYEISSVK